MCIGTDFVFNLLLLQSVTFKTTSRNLARAMCMKNLKLTVVIVLGSLVSKSEIIVVEITYKGNALFFLN